MFSTLNLNMAYGFIKTKYFNNTFQDLTVLQLHDPLVCSLKERRPNNLAWTHFSSSVYLYTNSLRYLQAKTSLSHCYIPKSGHTRKAERKPKHKRIPKIDFMFLFWWTVQKLHYNQTEKKNKKNCYNPISEMGSMCYTLLENLYLREF